MLNTYQVEYLLIGGYAVGYYGYPRATGDIDVWVAMQPHNAARILDVLQAFGFGSDAVSAETLLQANQIVRMGVPPLRIELVTTISGVEFEECYARRMIAMIDDIEVNVISLDDLKRNKQASGRLKDLNDLENLP